MVLIEMCKELLIKFPLVIFLNSQNYLMNWEQPNVGVNITIQGVLISDLESEDTD